MNINAIKLICECVSSLSVGTTIGNIIKSNIPKNISKLSKVETVIGSFVISSVLGDIAAKQLDEMFDGIEYERKEVD